MTTFAVSFYLSGVITYLRVRASTYNFAAQQRY